jgi:hypothetical protein
VRKEHLGIPVAEKKKDVLPHPAPLEMDADGIKFL